MPADVRRTKAAFVIANPKAKLLDQLREVARVKHFSLRTEQSYADWVVRFLKWARDHPHLIRAETTEHLSPNPSPHPMRRGELGAEKKWRHPRELGAAEVGAFLSHLAVGKGVAVSTQNQALNAIVFLYEQVLHVELGDLQLTERPSRPARLPVVLSPEEVA